MTPDLTPGTNHSRRFAGSRRFARENDMAATSLAGIGAIGITVAAVIIGAVISLSILSELFPTFKESVANLSENVTTGTWGNATADAISSPFAMLISLGGLFAIVALAFGAYKLAK